MVPAHLPAVIDTRQGIGTDTCYVDNVFPPDGFCFGSDIIVNSEVLNNL